MASDGRVVIDTELDSSGAKSGMQKLGRTLGKIGGGVLAKGTVVQVVKDDIVPPQLYGYRLLAPEGWAPSYTSGN